MIFLLKNDSFLANFVWQKVVWHFQLRIGTDKDIPIINVFSSLNCDLN